ncbi:MAG: hypothetical protein V1827_04180 [Candidatus Micrarchaeota archaeon]
MGAGRKTISPTTGTASPHQTGSRNRRSEFEYVVMGKRSDNLDPKAISRISANYHGALVAADRSQRGAGEKIRSVFSDLASGRIANDFVQLSSRRIKNVAEGVKPEHLPEFLDEMHSEMLADPKRADSIPQAMLRNYQLTGGRVKAKSLVKMARAGFRKSGSDCPKEASEAAKREFEAGRLDSIEGVATARAGMRFPEVSGMPDQSAEKISEGAAVSAKPSQNDPTQNSPMPTQAPVDAVGMHPAAIWNADIEVDKRSSKADALPAASESRRAESYENGESQTISLDGGKNQGGVRPGFSLKGLSMPAWLTLRLGPKEQRGKEADGASEEAKKGSRDREPFRRILPPMDMAYRPSAAAGKALGPDDQESVQPKVKPLIFEDGFGIIKTPKGPAETSPRGKATAISDGKNAKMRKTANRFKLKAEGPMKKPKRKKAEEKPKPEAPAKKAGRKPRKNPKGRKPPRLSEEKKPAKSAKGKKSKPLPEKKAPASKKPAKAEIAEKALQTKKTARKKPAPKAEKGSVQADPKKPGPIQHRRKNGSGRIIAGPIRASKRTRRNAAKNGETVFNLGG